MIHHEQEKFAQEILGEFNFQKSNTLKEKTENKEDHVITNTIVLNEVLHNVIKQGKDLKGIHWRKKSKICYICTFHDHIHRQS